MHRVLLIHWKTEEAPERIARLQAAGYEAEHCAPRSAEELTAIKENPPDAFVIDLSRIPSHGREIGSFLRRQKATRNIPVVFVDGDPDKVERTRQLLPDAVYSSWPDIGQAVSDAVANPPAKPVVRDAMAGYSGSPLPKKLGIQRDTTVALCGAPDGFASKLGPLPDGATVRSGLRGNAKLILLFTNCRAELEKRFPAAARALEDRGAIWIAWPKKTSGVASDLSEAAVRAFGLEREFVDYKICAIDEKWSGLLFTRRRK